MPAKTKKVLIADDDVKIAEMLAEALSGEGYETYKVTQALRFFDSVVEHEPDLILLDLLMPYLDGEDELHLMQMNAATSHIPVIVVTAMPDAKRQISKYKPLGVLEIVEKPFNLSKLLDLIHRTIG